MITQLLLRGGIPFIIMAAIAVILYTQGDLDNARSTFFASLIALFVGGATVIYNIDTWSFTKQSIIHFLIMFVTVYPVLLLSGWFNITSVIDAFKVFLIFILVGAVLWTSLTILAKIFKW